MTGRPLKSPGSLGLKWSILGGSSPCTALVPSSSIMNCDAAAAPSLLLGLAKIVTRDPTAIPHGSSTATGVLPANRSFGTETVAGQEDAGADGDGEEEEERRLGRSGAAAAKAEDAEDSILSVVWNNLERLESI